MTELRHTLHVFGHEDSSVPIYVTKQTQFINTRTLFTFKVVALTRSVKNNDQRKNNAIYGLETFQISHSHLKEKYKHLK